VDATVAAPGLCDFAVRGSLSPGAGPRFLSESEPAPEIAASIASRAQRFVTIAKRPSAGLGMGGLYDRSRILKSGIFWLAGLDKIPQKRR